MARILFYKNAIKNYKICKNAIKICKNAIKNYKMYKVSKIVAHTVL